MTSVRCGWAVFAVAWLSFASPTAAGERALASTAAWDSVARFLGTPDVFASGYHRFNLPRRDIALRIGDVSVAPELALGAWAGFTDDAMHATLMGDLVLTSQEVHPVLAELDRQGIGVSAIHNHLVGEEPRLVYAHVHAMGDPVELAKRLDRVLRLTGTPRPVAPASAAPLAIDTSAVFGGLGRSGRAHGAVAQVGFVFVPGEVRLDGHVVTPALGYGSPVNVQMVGPDRAVATGDFAVLGSRVAPVLHAFASHGITGTALHTHMIGESPTVYFIHFWADGSLADVVRGLRAAVDAAR